MHVRVCSDRNCNPSLLSLVSNVTSAQPVPGTNPETLQLWDAQSVVGLVIFLFCTLYARSVPTPSGPTPSGPTPSGPSPLGRPPLGLRLGGCIDFVVVVGTRLVKMNHLRLWANGNAH